MATGGTPYGPPAPSAAPRVANPGGRPQAVARNLNAPGGGKRAPRPNAPQKGTPKGRGAPKPPAAKVAAPKSPFYGGEIPNIGGLATPLERQQVGAPIYQAEQTEKAATRAPFAAKAGEINYTEGQVANRIGAMNQTTQGYLQGLVAGSEGSAKTANNFAAESVLQAQKGVETAGQNAQTNIGGFTPAIAQAQAQGTEERGTANTAALRQIAAASAVRGPEEQATARNRFMTERQRNQVAENTALERIGAKGKSERLEAGQKLFTDLEAKKQLEQRGAEGQAKLNQGAQKIAQGNTKLALTLRGQVSKAQETRERVKATERGQTLAQYRAEQANIQRENASKRTRATGEERNRNQARTNEIRQGQYEEQDRIAREKITASLSKTKASPAQYKLSGELGSAFNSVGLLRSNQKKANQGPQPAQIRQFLSTGQSFKSGGNTIKIAKVQNPILQTAAIELYYNPGHKVSATTSAELGAMGINLGAVRQALGL